MGLAPKLTPFLRFSRLRPLLLNQTQIPKTPLPLPQIPSPMPNPTRNLSTFPIKNPFLSSSRSFSSSPSSSNMVLIGSEQGFNAALSKVQDEKLPTIFYFTAVWCGPCKMLAPVIEEQSKKFPHVTTYKIDIDQEGLETC